MFNLTLALLTLLWLFISPGLVHAQVYRVRMVGHEQRCTQLGCTWTPVERQCSAVAVGRYQEGHEILLTAGHCLRKFRGEIDVLADSGWVRAVSLGSVMDDGADLSILGVKTAEQLRCVAIAEDAPAVGETVEVQGFPNGGSFRSRAAAVVQHNYRSIDLVVGVPTIPGESGGAVLYEDRLAGIISATGPRERPTHTIATGAARVRRFLLENRGGIPSCHPPGPAETNTLPPIPATRRPPNQPPSGVQDLRAELSRLKRRISELETRLDEIAQRPGPAGPRGPPGPAGPPGETLVLPNRDVWILAPDGRVIDKETYKPGEPIKLRLVPRRRETGDR